MAAVLKTAEVQAFVSSNLTRSARTPTPGPVRHPARPVSLPTMRRRGPSTGVLALVAVLVAVGLGGWTVVQRGTGCLFAGERCLRVLFIGNSYTSTNGLPDVFAALVRSGGGAVEVAMIAPGGATLADHAANPDVTGAIAGTHWTAVVLQEQSQLPASPAAVTTQMLPAASVLADQVRAAGATPYLLQTWAHRDGWPEMGQDRVAMQAAINAAYRDVAARTGAIVIPAGEAWAAALAEAPGITLWQDDGSHPALAGTYLAACALYVALTGQRPEGLAENGGLTSADAAALQAAATP